MSGTTNTEGRDAVLEIVGHLQALAIMGQTKTQQETALKMASRLLSVLPLIDPAAPAVPAATSEPVMPRIDAPTTDWFVYYRQMIAYLSRELPRLQRIEAAALRVASARRDGIVKDQPPLDALDEALEAQP